MPVRSLSNVIYVLIRHFIHQLNINFDIHIEVPIWCHDTSLHYRSVATRLSCRPLQILNLPLCLNQQRTSEPWRDIRKILYSGFLEMDTSFE